MGRSGLTAARRRPTAALQRALDPAVVEERARRGRRERKFLGLVPYGDWSKETSAQSFLRLSGPASEETRAKAATKLGIDAGRLVHPLLSENTVASLRWELDADGAAAWLSSIDERWERQGREYAPWDGGRRQWQAIVEAAVLLEPAVQKLGLGLTRAQLEEHLAAPFAPLNRDRIVDFGGPNWWPWLNRNTQVVGDRFVDEFPYELRKAVGKRADQRLGELAFEMSRADFADERHVRTRLRQLGMLGSLETFAPYRDLLLANADKARTIFGWLDGPGSAEWQLTLYRDDRQKIAAAVGEALYLREQEMSDRAGVCDWLLEPNELLDNQTPKQLLLDDVVANARRVVAAAAAAV